MERSIYEIPKRLARALPTIGPIHEDVRGGYCFTVSLIVTRHADSAGFLIEQRLAERSMPAAESQGLSFKVPVRADVTSEPAFIYAETLGAALEYVGRRRAEGST